MKDNSNARLICSLLRVGSDDVNPRQVQPYQVKLIFYSLRSLRVVYVDQDFRCCDVPWDSVTFY